MESRRTRLPSTGHEIPSLAANIRPSNPNETGTVSLILRHKSVKPLRVGQSGERLTPAEFAEQYGADPADTDRISKFASALGLAVSEVNLGRRTIILRGPVGALSRAFGVHLKSFELGGVEYRTHTEDISIPAEFKDIVEGVFGLDNLPAARHH